MISIVIKGEEGRINFQHALAEMFAPLLHRIKYGRICMVETSSNSIQTYLWRSVGIDTIFTFLLRYFSGVVSFE